MLIMSGQTPLNFQTTSINDTTGTILTSIPSNTTPTNIVSIAHAPSMDLPEKTSAFNGLPTEMMLQIAYNVAAPNNDTPSDSDISERHRYAPIDLSLRSVNRASRKATFDVLAKKFAFVRILSYECPEKQGCQGKMKKEFQEWYGTLKRNRTLAAINALHSADLSTVTFHLGCEHSHLNQHKHYQPTLVAFLEIDDYRTLLLCGLVQCWDVFSIEVNAQTPTVAIKKLLNCLMDDIRCFVFNKDMSIDGKGAHTRELDISSLQVSLDRRIVQTPDQVICLLEAHSQALQTFLDNSRSPHTLLSQVAVFLRAHRTLINDTIRKYHRIAPYEIDAMTRILCNHGCTVVDTLSGHLLEQTLTTSHQRHSLISHERPKWMKSAWYLLTSAIYPFSRGWAIEVNNFLSTGQPVSNEGLELLRRYCPVIKSMTQLCLAWARLQLLPGRNVEPELEALDKLSKGAKGCVIEAETMLDWMEYVLSNTRDGVYGGCYRFDVEENLFWVMDMRYLISQIRTAEFDVSSVGSNMGLVARDVLKKPVMQKEGAWKKYQLPYLTYHGE